MVYQHREYFRKHPTQHYLVATGLKVRPTTFPHKMQDATLLDLLANRIETTETAAWAKRVFTPRSAGNGDHYGSGAQWPSHGARAAISEQKRFSNLTLIVWNFIGCRHCKGSLMVLRCSLSSCVSSAARLVSALPHDCERCGDHHHQLAPHCRSTADQSPR